MNRKNLTKLIPLGITLVLLTITIVQLFILPNNINWSQVKIISFLTDRFVLTTFGYILILISLLLKKDYWKYLFALFLMISCTPFITFFYRSFYFGIGFIKLEFLSLTLLIAHLFLNKDIIRVASKRLEPSQESRIREKELKETQFEKTVSRFEGKFSAKQKDELEIIVTENRLVPEAVEAAKRLIKNK